MPEQDILSALESKPEFQKLSEDAKKMVRSKVAAKFGGLSTEAKQIVYKKLGSTGNPGTALKEPGMLGKAWDALAVPAQKSREGLNMIAEALPETGNTQSTALNVAIGTPRVLAETAAEAAPGFIDRGAIVTGGLGAGAKVAGKVAGKVIPKVAPMLEKGSGLRPGTINEAFKDPGMIVDFSAAQKAKKLYQEAKTGLKYDGPVPPTHVKIVTDATKKLALNKLTAPEAFEARKSIRALKKSKQYSMDYLEKQEKLFDDVVDKGVDKADKLYRKAMLGENMRNISRLNKNGTTGPVSAAIMAKIPFLAPLMSPAIQGGAASLAGAAAQIPMRGTMNTGSMVGAGLDRLSKRKEKKHGKR